MICLMRSTPCWRRTPRSSSGVTCRRAASSGLFAALGVRAVRVIARREHVDHGPDTGWVPGIGCSHCNDGLGWLRDDADRLTNAISYLKGTTWQRVSIHPGVFRLCSPRRLRPPSRTS
ncbi:endonuclease domain-containing protein [Pilimelia columellifera]|uniref:endonuclease domain-containing protein n=1 Tax=Pilimelia columellifera TaxID=706574 RepID=UPI0031D37196